MVRNDISLAITKPEELIHVHLEPSKGRAPLKVRELSEYREVFYFLTWRDVKLRYKQTAYGFAPTVNIVWLPLLFLLGIQGFPYP